MPVRTLKLSELTQLAPAERARAIAQFSRSQPLNGEADAIRTKIAAYEMRYEMSSQSMLAKFNRGELKETADIGRWLILLSIQDGMNSENV